MRRFALLDPLRGLAALWVFFFHMPLAQGWSTALGPFYSVIRLGHLGVPMFFVVSGFCIAAAGTGAARSGEVRTFVRRRLRRIYPPYWFSIAVVCALPFVIEIVSAVKTGQYAAPASDNINHGFMSYALHDWMSVLTLARVFIVDPDATNLQHKFTTINAVYWTLAIEVQFYLVVALAALARRRFYAVLAAVTAVSVPVAAMDGAYLSGVFLPYWPMFAIGVAIFWLFERGAAPSQILGPHAVRYCMLGIVAGLVGFLGYAAFGGDVGALPFALLFGSMLYCAEGLDQRFQRLLAVEHRLTKVVLQGVMAIGAMSYTVYLLHGRLQFLSLQFTRQLLTSESMVRDVAVVLLTLAMCYPFFRLCEEPFAGPGRRKAKARQPGARGGLTDRPRSSIA